MKVLFIINPGAGGRAADKVKGIVESLFKKAGWDIESVVTHTPEEAENLIKSCEEKGFNLLVIGGGDGSIHHLVQHLPIGSTEKAQGIPFGIIPLGSGNDFYRGVGAPMDLEGAAENIINGFPVPIDVGLVEALNEDGSLRKEKPLRFTNTVGIGIDSQTLATREKSPKWLSARYEILFLLTLSFMIPVNAKIKTDVTTTEFEGYWILACNNGVIGTGMKIAPEAKINDGLLDLVLVEKIPKLQLAINLPKVFKGTHIKVKGFSVSKVRTIELSCRPPLRLAIDGDREFEPPARISILPGAVRLMTSVTKGPQWL